MSNAAVVFRNLADDGTITASSSILLAQAATVQQEHVERRWRSVTQTAHLIVDLGEDGPALDTIAAIGLTATLQRCRVSSTDASGAVGDLYDSGWEPVDQAYRQAICVLPESVTGRYVRIDLSHNARSYVEAGRLVIGLRSKFRYSFGYGWGRGYVDPSVRTQTRGGQTQISRRRPLRTIDVNFELVTEDDLYSFVEVMERENALQKDILFLLNPDSNNLARDTIWGLMSEMHQVLQPYPDHFSKQYRIEERR